MQNLKRDVQVVSNLWETIYSELALKGKVNIFTFKILFTLYVYQ